SGAICLGRDRPPRPDTNNPAPHGRRRPAGRLRSRTALRPGSSLFRKPLALSSFPTPTERISTMKTESMSYAFTVMMHPTLVDELDEGFSPMDGLVAIDQMFGELPLLHQALAHKRLRKRRHRRLTVYRGCYDWYKSLGFSYVQIGTTLHVLELWYDDNPNLSQ